MTTGVLFYLDIIYIHSMAPCILMLHRRPLNCHLGDTSSCSSSTPPESQIPSTTDAHIPCSLSSVSYCFLCTTAPFLSSVHHNTHCCLPNMHSPLYDATVTLFIQVLHENIDKLCSSINLVLRLKQILQSNR